MLFQAILGACLKLIKIPTGLGNPNDRQIKALIADQPLQRRKNLFVGEVASGSHKYECV